jgi:hypothetical protein
MKRAWPPGVVTPAQRAAAHAAHRDCRRRRARGAAGDEQLREQHARKARGAGVSPMRRARQVRHRAGEPCDRQQRSAQLRHAAQRLEAPRCDVGAALRVSTMRQRRTRAAPRRSTRGSVAWRLGGVCSTCSQGGCDHLLRRWPRPQRLRGVTQRRHALREPNPASGVVCAEEEPPSGSLATRRSATRGGSRSQAGVGTRRESGAARGLPTDGGDTRFAAPLVSALRPHHRSALQRLRPCRHFPALDGRGRAALFV